MMKKNFLLLWIICYFHVAHSQNTIAGNSTNGQAGSLYSSFGLGSILKQGVGLTESLGHSGIGLRSNFFVNNLNPAGLNSITEPMNTIFDLGLNLSYKVLDDGNEATSMFDGGISHLNAWFRIGDRWGSSITFSPYSDFSYNILANRYSESVGGNYNVLYGGNGGINQLAWGNGIDIGERLSIGVKARLLFGALNRTEDFLSNSDIPRFTYEESIFIQGLAYDFGLQYAIPIQEASLTAGVIFSPDTRLGSTSESLLQQGTSIIEGDDLILENYRLPTTYGLGVSWQSKRLLLATDVVFERWSLAEINTSVELTGTWKWSFGGEWLPAYDKYKRYNQMFLLRYGVFVENSEFVYEGTNFLEWGFNVGVALPFNRFSNHVQLTYGYERKGTLQNDLILENTHKISLSFSLRDIWFVKPKIR